MTLGETTRRMAVLAMGIAVLALAAPLAACGGKDGGEGGKPKAQTLRIYNWSDYIDPSLLKDFEKETGIKVVYDTFDSNEVLETKMLAGGTGYDIVVPSNHNVPRYITAGAIQPLDKSKLTGLGDLSPTIMAYMQPFDPGGKYAIPYMWGTIGIGYNPEAVAKRLPGVKIDSWAVVFDPKNLAKLKDCGVYFLDASEDMYAVALHYLGKDPNTTNPADIAAATDLMVKLRPYVRKFHSSETVEALANGDICIAIGYSGDILQSRKRAQEAGGKVKVEYAVPSDGTQVWFDVFTIPADAPNPQAAYTFLNYIMRPEVIAKATNFTEYANASAKATPLVDASVRDNPNVYPTPELLKKMFVTTTKDQALLRVVSRDWTKVTTGQ